MGVSYEAGRNELDQTLTGGDRVNMITSNMNLKRINKVDEEAIHLLRNVDLQISIICTTYVSV